MFCCYPLRDRGTCFRSSYLRNSRKNAPSANLAGLFMVWSETLWMGTEAWTLHEQKIEPTQHIWGQGQRKHKIAVRLVKHWPLWPWSASRVSGLHGATNRHRIWRRIDIQTPPVWRTYRNSSGRPDVSARKVLGGIWRNFILDVLTKRNCGAF